MSAVSILTKSYVSVPDRNERENAQIFDQQNLKNEAKLNEKSFIMRVRKEFYNKHTSAKSAFKFKN